MIESPGGVASSRGLFLIVVCVSLCAIPLVGTAAGAGVSYTIVDTGQARCCSDDRQIEYPKPCAAARRGDNHGLKR